MWFSVPAKIPAGSLESQHVCACVSLQNNIRCTERKTSTYCNCCRYSPTLSCHYYSNTTGTTLPLQCFLPIAFHANLAVYSSAVWKNEKDESNICNHKLCGQFSCGSPPTLHAKMALQDRYSFLAITHSKYLRPALWFCWVVFHLNSLRGIVL